MLFTLGQIQYCTFRWVLLCCRLTFATLMQRDSYKPRLNTIRFNTFNRVCVRPGWELTKTHRAPLLIQGEAISPLQNWSGWETVQLRLRLRFVCGNVGNESHEEEGEKCQVDTKGLSDEEDW